MEAGFVALRRSPALGVCVALACSLAIAAPALAGSPAPDPSPGPTPDPYAAPAATSPVATTPLRPRGSAPAVHEVIRAPAPSSTQAPAVHEVIRAPAPSSTQAPAVAIVPKRVARHHAPTAVTTRAPASPPRSIPTGPVRSFAGVVAAEVETTHHLSRTLALSVALLVLLSGTFVLTAAREVAR